MFGLNPMKQPVLVYFPSDFNSAARGSTEESCIDKVAKATVRRVTWQEEERNCEELTHLKTTLLWRAAYCVGGESHRRSRRHNPVSQPLRSFFFFPLSLLCEVNIQILTPFISSINWLSWQVLFVSLLLLSPSSSWNLVRAREGMIRKTCGGGVWRMTACCNIG